MNQQASRLKFSDLIRAKKGEAFDARVNEIPMQAVKAAKDENLFDAFKAVEDNKWFGQLRGKGMTFSFRHGVCQSFTKTMDAYGYVFEMNIINDAVDFRKEKV